MDLGSPADAGTPSGFSGRVGSAFDGGVSRNTVHSRKGSAGGRPRSPAAGSTSGLEPGSPADDSRELTSATAAASGLEAGVEVQPQTSQITAARQPTEAVGTPGMTMDAGAEGMVALGEQLEQSMSALNCTTNTRVTGAAAPAAFEDDAPLSQTLGFVKMDSDIDFCAAVAGPGPTQRKESVQWGSAPASEPPKPTAEELERENKKLRAQVESLQRLMENDDKGAQITRLKEDLTTKAKRCKELEQELDKQKKEVDEGKTEVSKLRKQLRSQQRGSLPPVGEEDEIEQREKKIEELERKLNKANERAKKAEQEATTIRRNSISNRSDLQTPRADVTQLNRTTAQMQAAKERVDEVQKENDQLRLAVSQRDTALQQLILRLHKAQDAIIESAGSGWESDVKLHQTKAMLQRMLEVAGHQASNEDGKKSPAGCMFKDADGKVVYLLACAEQPDRAMEMVKFVNGARHGIVGALQFKCVGPGQNIELHDIRGQGGLMHLPADVQSDGTLSRIASLAEACGIPHNIPGASGEITAQSPCPPSSTYSPPPAHAVRMVTPPAGGVAHRPPLSRDHSGFVGYPAVPGLSSARSRSPPRFTPASPSHLQFPATAVPPQPVTTPCVWR